MELILWRHAEAEDVQPGTRDEQRRLTTRGEKQARDMAKWLRRQLPDTTQVLVSPATRTVQTADALKLDYQVEPRIGTSARPDDLLRAARWPEGDGAVLLVGHQPTLGQVAAALMGAQTMDWSVKKGAVWWLSTKLFDGKPQTTLRGIFNPDML
jgi:phosphohistidine phosphatase